MPANARDNVKGVFIQRRIEQIASSDSSADSSFDSESHGIKDSVSDSSETMRLDATEQPQVAITVAAEEEAEVTEQQSCLRRISDPASILSDNYLTVSGTIQRGRKKGENVDVILNMSREELEGLEASLAERKTGCNTKCGPHILLFSVLTAPFAAVLSAIYSFFIGTLTWYNIFSFFTELALVWRIALTPFLILSYPFLIVSLSAGLGIVSAVYQITWYWPEWVKQNADPEKGFFGWLCNALRLPDCSPYEVIVLSGMQTGP